MSSPEKPVIVLVHGAWHRPLHYIELINGLRFKGFTVVAPLNATAGWDNTIVGKTHFDDVRLIQSAMNPYLDAGKEVVLVCHSYGGIPGTAAAESNTVAERKAKGENGGIISVVYIAAFALPQPGLSLWIGVGGVKPDWWDIQDEVALAHENGPSRFYNDIDQTTADICTSGLVKQSLASFMTTVSYTPAEIKVPKTYVACKLDQAVPFEIQLGLGQAAGAEVVEFASGHSPFLKNYERLRLIDIIERAAVSRPDTYQN